MDVVVGATLSKTRMSFIISNNKISFASYRALSRYREEFPIVIEIIHLLDNWFDMNKDAIEVRTSGSTGDPKLISLSKSSIRKSAHKTINYFNLNSKCTLLLCLPVKFIAGKLMVIRAMEAGADLIILQPSTRPLAGISIDIDFVAMTPMQLTASLNYDDVTLSRVDVILLGGAPVSAALESAVRELDTAVFHGFGMTETITHIAMRRLNGLVPMSQYHAMPGVSFSIDDNERLVISAHHLLESILTNDIVTLHDEVSFSWRGRYDNVFNSGGIKLYPQDIERKIADLISNRYIICSAPDKILGQKCILLIESADESSKKLIKENISKVLDTFERPKEIHLIHQFSETENGKIDRNATKAQLKKYIDS